MKAHANGDLCVATATNHAPTVSTHSSTVFVNGKEIARIGDKYNSESSQDHRNYNWCNYCIRWVGRYKYYKRKRFLNVKI